jgi:putative lipoic acid-binding regulatory protein
VEGSNRGPHEGSVPEIAWRNDAYYNFSVNTANLGPRFEANTCRMKIKSITTVRSGWEEGTVVLHQEPEFGAEEICIPSSTGHVSSFHLSITAINRKQEFG